MNLNKPSIYCSLLLRHDDTALPSGVDREGWASVEEVVSAVQAHFKSFTLDDLKRMVAEDSKQRYTIRGEHIRANQGHSNKKVQIKFDTHTPPAELYHGTTSDIFDALVSGSISELLGMDRHYVHLTHDLELANKAATRRKNKVPAILVVNTNAMIQDGYSFLKSTNDVWLVESVPFKYLSIRNY